MSDKYNVMIKNESRRRVNNIARKGGKERRRGWWKAGGGGAMGGNELIAGIMFRGRGVKPVETIFQILHFLIKSGKREN